MFRFPTYWLIAAVTVVALAAVLLADPGPRADVDAAWGETGDPEVDAARAELDAKQDAVMGRIAYKEALISRLVAGRATLDEVTAEFLRLNRDTMALDMIRFQYPGSSDEEKTARNVLEYVRLQRLPADQDGRVTARLRQEFERRFGDHPDPAQ
jgi:hypothetical protein